MKRIALIIIMIAMIMGTSNAFSQNDSYYRKYFEEHISELDPIEGIYSVSEELSLYKHNYCFFENTETVKYVIYKSSVLGIYLRCITCDDIRNNKSLTALTLERIGETNVYDFKYTDGYYDSYSNQEKKIESNSRIYLESLFRFDLQYSVTLTPEYTDRRSLRFIKEYPTKTMYDNAIAKSQHSNWSGSGFALGNGYLVTNYHVVEDAKTINVKGIRGDFNNGYSAEVVATDKVNDIAILKIEDNQFSGFGTIPYGVSSKMADVGESIFVLGYPLTQTMGDEIKLTDGLISSRTGFQGDIANYQMSAPVQPGNSGGPMFNSKGNVIGIVCAHHAGAENAGYSIKISYLKLLIESAGLNITLPTNNTISTLSLPEKVKRVKNFVFFIECSQ